MKKTMPAPGPSVGESRTPTTPERLCEALPDDAVREQARRRLRGKPGFFASLAPDTLEMIRNYDGPERLGGPGPVR